MAAQDTLPTAFEAMAALPSSHGRITSVIVEPVDAGRSRLAVSVPAGSVLDAVLLGRPGWFREPDPFRGRRLRTTSTYWRWVLAEPAALTSANREDEPDEAGAVGDEAIGDATVEDAGVR